MVLVAILEVGFFNPSNSKMTNNGGTLIYC